ncbi:MAG: DUF2812 domain-containing protein [Clostridia bacterium]|nr:DUF2812 domain-containing protein [Clostridia bacterium]
MAQAERKEFYYLYTPAMINSMERWLIKKAADGWRLEEVHGCKFVFRKCQPYETVYAAYSGFGTEHGVASDYWISNKRYSSKTSVLNKSAGKVFEADINKIDSQFKYFILIRNKYYLKHYIGMLILALIWIFLTAFLLSSNSAFIAPLIFAIIFFIYSVFSVCMLVRERKLKGE